MDAGGSLAEIQEAAENDAEASLGKMWKRGTNYETRKLYVSSGNSQKKEEFKEWFQQSAGGGYIADAYSKSLAHLIFCFSALSK
jgi:hypothetical protein